MQTRKTDGKGQIDIFIEVVALGKTLVQTGKKRNSHMAVYIAHS